jgi:hypothetical protein
MRFPYPATRWWGRMCGHMSVPIKKMFGIVVNIVGVTWISVCVGVFGYTAIYILINDGYYAWKAYMNPWLGIDPWIKLAVAIPGFGLLALGRKLAGTELSPDDD